MPRRRELSSDIASHYGAIFARQRFGEKLQAFVQRYDALITPTLPILAFEVGRECPEGRDYQSWFEWACFLYPFNLSRQPAASVPIGFSTSGLPIGAQIVGALYKDAHVVAIARAIERLIPRRSLERSVGPDQSTLSLRKQGCNIRGDTSFK